LNGLALGRIDFGIGTGFSARRAMGLGAVTRRWRSISGSSTGCSTIRLSRPRSRVSDARSVFSIPNSDSSTQRTQSLCTFRLMARARRR
jgi:hypothetical protein